MRNLIILVLILLVLSCQENERIPYEMNIAFDYINKTWDKKSIEQFKNRTKNDTTFEDYHFGIGLNIRNYLLRNGEHSDKLTRFFDSVGVSQYDDMSGIILYSYHKYLNKENIELNSQIEKVNEYWEPIIECQKAQEIKGLEIYNKYKFKDTINIKMPVFDSNSAVDYRCPDLEWEFREPYDLSINGVIIDKGLSISGTNAYFTVKILEKNHEGTKIFMSEKNIGDEVTVMLKETAWKIE